jgi:hypothetical protein
MNVAANTHQTAKDHGSGTPATGGATCVTAYAAENSEVFPRESVAVDVRNIEPNGRSTIKLPAAKIS